MVEITTHGDKGRRFLKFDGSVVDERGALVAAALPDNHPEAWRKRLPDHGESAPGFFWRSVWTFLKESW
jgi:hypothetical protein